MAPTKYPTGYTEAAFQAIKAGDDMYAVHQAIGEPIETLQLERTRYQFKNPEQYAYVSQYGVVGVRGGEGQPVLDCALQHKPIEIAIVRYGWPVDSIKLDNLEYWRYSEPLHGWGSTDYWRRGVAINKDTGKVEYLVEEMYWD
jgi:hypothetical protein